MQSAQDAAALYLEEICHMREETREKCQRLLDKANREAEAILDEAHKARSSDDFTLEAIIREFGQK
jgi:F0F1-type ATP synthase membrane subunit b/b'